MNQLTPLARSGFLRRKRQPDAAHRLVDPATCTLWAHHNRNYARLSAETCADLIEGLRAQGKQEFPAIVRETRKGYEIITGARRHWAVTWLRANGHPDFRYLIEVRNLTDEQAFRLADIENRHRQDISDYERATDYAHALTGYYGGKQKAMATALEVSPTWLSRYLDLAKLPPEIIEAFGDSSRIRERHARTVKPLLANTKTRQATLDAAVELAREQQENTLDATQVVRRLTRACRKKIHRPNAIKIYKRDGEDDGVAFRKTGNIMKLEFKDTLSRAALSDAINKFTNEHFPSGNR